MNKRELRLKIQRKLDDRRKLSSQNDVLRRQNGDIERDNEFLKKVTLNPLVSMVLEECADQIVEHIFTEAQKASESIAEQTQDNGDYVVGISIPSFYIRHRISRFDVEHVGHMNFNEKLESREMKYIHYDRVKRD